MSGLSLLVVTVSCALLCTLPFAQAQAMHTIVGLVSSGGESQLIYGVNLESKKEALVLSLEKQKLCITSNFVVIHDCFAFSYASFPLKRGNESMRFGLVCLNATTMSWPFATPLKPIPGDADDIVLAYREDFFHGKFLYVGLSDPNADFAYNVYEFDLVHGGVSDPAVLTIKNLLSKYVSRDLVLYFVTSTGHNFFSFSGYDLMGGRWRFQDVGVQSQVGNFESIAYTDIDNYVYALFQTNTTSYGVFQVLNSQYKPSVKPVFSFHLTDAYLSDSVFVDSFGHLYVVANSLNVKKYQLIGYSMEDGGIVNQIPIKLPLYSLSFVVS
jgi:hypothetical protein